MLEHVKAAYTNYRWLRLAACVGLLVCGALLYWLSGGFPPWAWRLLFQVLPQIPRLWQLQGLAILLPLSGLVLLSLMLLIMWGALVTACLKVAQHWWYNFHERRRFAMELQEAEHLAERMVGQIKAGETQQTEMAVVAARFPQQQAYVGLPGAQGPVLSTDTKLPQQTSHQPVAQREPASATGTTSSGYQQARPRPAPPMSPVPLTSPPPAPISTRDRLHIVPRTDEVQDGYEQDPLSDVETESPLVLTVGVGLHRGWKRSNAPNEDSLFAVQGVRITDGGPQPIGLFVVADGMGGHTNGQEASRLAIQTISAVVIPRLLSDRKVIFPDLLSEGVNCANLAIYQRNQERANPRGEMMGTTMTAALVIDMTAYIANVGDSRAYLCRRAEGLSQLTQDHSYVARLVKIGKIAREDIYTHPRRNVIERCLGESASLEVDSFKVSLRADDVLVLCSDGLWEMVRDTDIEKIVKNGSNAMQRSHMLVQAALNHGGDDNISVVVVCAREE